ncbi:hypothetical protein M9H77_35063 [Catharanthus roseus]|uniref:Uncharacterized protein n=1 Tax=Catharanthus roseus TaxID=4058 RepID=A0ACB9ZPU2_CATRO|nr:hypothetical protein M9H77_35063 [Catharanthus roseus]
MAEQEESRKVQYPLNSKDYEIIDEIGRGASAIVYKALCIPMNFSEVAIKSINLEKSKADLDNIRRETKTVSLLSHPNILKAHCCFTVDRRVWVVMPFMSAGSLQSIITSSFPNGLPEPCIAIILKETLCALSYLHDQGHLHRDVKAGNILMDSNGSVKLADFGVSASIYESSSSSASSAGSSSSSLMLTDVAGTPYWMAPEVIHSHTGYSFKADIWSFGITALELAHGRPPLSHLPPSKSLLMKITTRFRFSDYEKSNVDSKKKKFTKSFKEMVGLCLDQDPSKRPPADKLLKHSFFKYCKGPDFLVKNVLQGLPSVEQRFMMSKLRKVVSMVKNDEEKDEEDSLEENIKRRRISGWNFNVEDFELNPVFPTEKGNDENPEKKHVTFGGETVISDKEGDSDAASNTSISGQVLDVSIESKPAASVNAENMLNRLFVLRKSLDDQRNMLTDVISTVFGKRPNPEIISREDQLLQIIEKLRNDLEAVKKKNSELELEIEFLKLQSTNE